MHKARAAAVVTASVGTLAFIATTHAAAAATPESSAPTVAILGHMPAASQVPAAHSVTAALRTAGPAFKGASGTVPVMREDECIMLGIRPL